MPTVTFTEAAAMVGWKSRSTLYRLAGDGRLNGYIVEENGRQLLELEPEGRPHLRDWLAGVVQQQITSPMLRTPGRHRPPPPTPEQVAEDRVAALEQRLGEALVRERDWIGAYYQFREWQTAECCADLMRALPDPAPIGDVMVTTRQLLLSRLKELDALELRSRAALQLWGKVSAGS
jgi:hypothetical protein